MRSAQRASGSFAFGSARAFWGTGARTLSVLIAFLGLPALAAAQAITPFRIPTTDAEPFGIVSGPDGSLWFTEHGPVGKIGRITTAGVFTEFPVPTVAGTPREITVGPDNNLWFTEEDGNNIAFTTTAGAMTEFPVPTAASAPAGITTGPDGNIWFTEKDGNKIGKCTTAGVITEFVVPTSPGGPREIVTGPDGNLWFTEHAGDKIGQITTAGVVTEFPVPTPGTGPRGIILGPDNNLWFTEELGNNIGKITTAGVVTEYPIPTSSVGPFGIAVGPDGNLWFTEETGNNMGRVTTVGFISELPIGNHSQLHRGITAGSDGNMWWCERGNNHIARITVGPLAPTALAVDPTPGNDVLEVGETVAIVPTWKNNGDAPQAVTGTASEFTGPAGATYTISDATADYGSIGVGASADCSSATGDCYSVHITAAARPAAHWDTTINETLSDNTIKGWTLHVGGSFTDVPTSQQFYKFIENIFHNGITGGCATGQYCPDNSVTRAQMAVFLLKGKHGQDYVPPSCTGVFPDVPCPSQFANWIEELSTEGITGGCGNGSYCPNNPVTRAQMAAFLLKAEHGSSYVPPPCTGEFADELCPSLFADWIERLAAEGITGGCGNGDYCPDSPNTRGQMAVFLVKTFGLLIYGP
jgi:streptogramin lyase